MDSFILGPILMLDRLDKLYINAQIGNALDGQAIPVKFILREHFPDLPIFKEISNTHNTYVMGVIITIIHTKRHLC